MPQSNYTLQPPLALIPIAFNHANLTHLSRFLLFGSLLLEASNSGGVSGGMDLSKVSEKFLISVRSARSIGFLPSTYDRPEVLSITRFVIACKN